LLSPVHTVAENCETTATVSLFCDSVDRALVASYTWLVLNTRTLLWFAQLQVST